MEVSAAQHHECVETERSWWRRLTNCWRRGAMWDWLPWIDWQTISVANITHNHSFHLGCTVKAFPLETTHDKTTTDQYIGLLLRSPTARSGHKRVRQEQSPTFGWNIRDGNCAVALTTILMNRTTYCLARRRTTSLSNRTFPLFKLTILLLSLFYELWKTSSIWISKLK